jgi:hypothetical protein
VKNLLHSNKVILILDSFLSSKKVIVTGEITFDLIYLDCNLIILYNWKQINYKSKIINNEMNLKYIPSIGTLINNITLL